MNSETQRTCLSPWEHINRRQLEEEILIRERELREDIAVGPLLEHEQRSTTAYVTGNGRVTTLADGEGVTHGRAAALEEGRVLCRWGGVQHWLKRVMLLKPTALAWVGAYKWKGIVTSNMAGRGRGGGQLIRDPDINRLDESHYVAGAIGFQDPWTLTPRGVVPNMPPPDCLVPYIREAGFAGPLEIRAFDYDMSLVSALDVAYRLGLRTDGDPISRCVRDFDQRYGVGTWQMA
ncbi:hypothetical protein PIB30_048821 [Stylosanthes scabra]|uniref:Uncharacterized protein n=1 Tax=Stylosanthes scabra TaxID=79078 RepID=A0ABU6RHY9_9FABA|nr:hypothetical protein [Stylosanthes scabra]